MQRLLIYILFFAALIIAFQGISESAGPKGFHLYVARFMDSDMVILDSMTHKEIGRVEFGFGSNPVEILPSMDKRLLYVSLRGTDEVAVIDVKSRKIKKRIKGVYHSQFMEISPDGRHLIVANIRTPYITVIDLTTDEVKGKPHIGEGSADVAVAANGIVYIAPAYDGDISVIDLKEMKKISAIKALASAIAISPDSTLLYFNDSSKNGLSILDIKTNRIIGDIHIGDSGRYITISQDGNMAFIPNYRRAIVTVIDLQTRVVVKDIAVGYEPATSALSPDGRFLYVVNYGNGDDDGSISVIDVKGLKEVERVKFYRWPRAIAVLPAG